jgi:hypothetical protein
MDEESAGRGEKVYNYSESLFFASYNRTKPLPPIMKVSSNPMSIRPTMPDMMGKVGASVARTLPSRSQSLRCRCQYMDLMHGFAAMSMGNVWPASSRSVDYPPGAVNGRPLSRGPSRSRKGTASRAQLSGAG